MLAVYKKKKISEGNQENVREKLTLVIQRRLFERPEHQKNLGASSIELVNTKQAFACNLPSHAVELCDSKLTPAIYCFESRRAQEQERTKIL